MDAITITRATKETDISLTLTLGGSGKTRIHTGIGFFDHMLTAFALHGSMDMELTVKGDLEVDGHHTVEDTGIVLGQALARLLADKSAIRRYGSFSVPMDESLVTCHLDISGRPFLVFRMDFRNQTCGGYDCCLTREFFRALAMNGGLTLHILEEYGDNDHHKIEAAYKAVGHALALAAAPREGGVLSTKGTLE